MQNVIAVVGSVALGLALYQDISVKTGLVYWIELGMIGVISYVFMLCLKAL